MINPTTQKIILDNGLTLLLTKSKKYDSVSIKFAIKTGSINDPKGKLGLSHMIEHMIFRIKSKDYENLAKLTKYNGIRYGALTNNISTIINARCLPNQIDIVLKLIHDGVIFNNYDAKEFEIEKNAVISEYHRAKKIPMRIIHNKIKNYIYGEKSVLTRNSLDSLDDNMNITLNDVIKHKKKYYVPNNMIVSITGNFNLENVKKKITKLFQHLKPKKVNLPKITTKNNNGIYDIEIDHFKKSCDLRVYLPFESKLKNVQTELRVLSSIIGIGKGSIMHQILRTKLGLCYSYNALVIDAGNKFGLKLEVNDINPEKLDFAQNELIKILNNIQDYYNDYDIKGNILFLKSELTYLLENVDKMNKAILSEELNKNKLNSIKTMKELENIDYNKIKNLNKYLKSKPLIFRLHPKK